MRMHIREKMVLVNEFEFNTNTFKEKLKGNN